MAAIICGYIAWIAWPHLTAVKVTNLAGVSQADEALIVQKMEQKCAFLGRREFITILSSLLDPRSRPDYFVEIDGTAEDIIIRAGYTRGELWGGGPVIKAKKKGGLWIFESSNMLWKS